MSHAEQDVHQTAHDVKEGVAKKNPDVDKMAGGSEPIGFLVLPKLFPFCSLSQPARHNW